MFELRKKRCSDLIDTDEEQLTSLLENSEIRLRAALVSGSECEVLGVCHVAIVHSNASVPIRRQ